MSCGCDAGVVGGAAAAWVVAEFGYRYGVRRSHQRLLYLEALGTVAREAGAMGKGGGERHTRTAPLLMAFCPTHAGLFACVPTLVGS